MEGLLSCLGAVEHSVIPPSLESLVRIGTFVTDAHFHAQIFRTWNKCRIALLVPLLSGWLWDWAVGYLPVGCVPCHWNLVGSVGSMFLGPE